MALKGDMIKLLNALKEENAKVLITARRTLSSSSSTPQEKTLSRFPPFFTIKALLSLLYRVESGIEF